MRESLRRMETLLGKTVCYPYCFGQMDVETSAQKLMLGPKLVYGDKGAEQTFYD